MAVCPIDEKGWCSRHKKVHVAGHARIALDPSPLAESYRQKWDMEMDNSRRPGTDFFVHHAATRPTALEPRGLGDLVEAALTKVGVTKERVEKFVGQPCGCDERKAKLNALGFWAKRVMGGAVEGAVKFLSNIVGQDLEKEEMKSIPWAYGVTTTEGRAEDGTLARTLASLAKAGFDRPRLFIDGTDCAKEWEHKFELDVTARTTPVKTASNWTLSMLELFHRDPDAERFAIFQDDCVASKNLRAYLDRCDYRQEYVEARRRIEGIYWNLYTVAINERNCPKDGNGKIVAGWHPSNLDPKTKGLGAVGLVFSRQAVISLFSNSHLIERQCDLERRFNHIDGGIFEAMHKAGWSEMVHYPSLIQHTGMKSAKDPNINYVTWIQNPNNWAESRCFFGENYDLLSLLPKT